MGKHFLTYLLGVVHVALVIGLALASLPIGLALVLNVVLSVSVGILLMRLGGVL